MPVSAELQRALDNDALDSLAARGDQDASFSELLSSQIDAIPLLNDASRPGSLVRFVGMVQDSLGQEVFAASSDELSCTEAGPGTSMLDASGSLAGEQLKERSVAYVVDVPGQTSWARDAAVGLDAKLGGLHVNGDSPEPVTHASKFPLPGVKHRAVIVKVRRRSRSSR